MSIKNIKLLAFDIDGTLMDDEKHFPECNRLALQACARRGIQIALISGRSFEMMRNFADILGIHPMLASCNGSRIDKSEFGPTLFETGFERKDAERVLFACESSGLYFNVYTRGKTYMGNPEQRVYLDEYHAKQMPGQCGTADYPYEIVNDNARLHLEGMNGVYKFVATGAEYDGRFELLRQALSDMNLSVSSAARSNIEFMPRGIDKGSALRLLCEHMRISTADVMAFGDQTNDIPMLSIAGHGVAMGNAESSVKECARHIALSNNLSGVGQFLNAYVLGDE